VLESPHRWPLSEQGTDGAEQRETCRCKVRNAAGIVPEAVTVQQAGALYTLVPVYSAPVYFCRFDPDLGEQLGADRRRPSHLIRHCCRSAEVLRTASSCPSALDQWPLEIRDWNVKGILAIANIPFLFPVGERHYEGPLVQSYGITVAAKVGGTTAYRGTRLTGVVGPVTVIGAAKASPPR
jgi:hypothetical protein